MKTKNRLMMVAIVVSTVFVACHKKDNEGQLTVRLTDAPANFTAVNVEITGLQVQRRDSSGGNGGWTSIPTKTGIYNLLELRDSVSVVLSNTYSFPVGYINQMRLMLGDSNTVVIDSTITADLSTPGAQQSGLKVNINAEIKPGGTTEVLLDFDAGQSIVEQGNGKFSLKPVIKVKEVTYH